MNLLQKRELIKISDWDSLHRGGFPLICVDGHPDDILGFWIPRGHHRRCRCGFRIRGRNPLYCQDFPSARAESSWRSFPNNDTGARTYTRVARRIVIILSSFQLGTSVGITVTTVVFNRVTRRNGPAVDNISSYHGAQWTSFAFGILGACSDFLALTRPATHSSRIMLRNDAVYLVF